MGFSAYEEHSVHVAGAGTYTDATKEFMVWRSPRDAVIQRVTFGVGEGFCAEGGTADMALISYGTGGSVPSSTLITTAQWGGTVWYESEVRSLPRGSMTIGTVAAGEYLAMEYSPQATNAGSILAPWCQIDYLYGGGEI